MAKQSQYTNSGYVLEGNQKEQNQAYRLLQLLDAALVHSLKDKDPLEKFLINLRQYCISNKMKEITATLPTETNLIPLTEPIELEAGTLIVVESRLGWDIKYNDVYFVEEIKEDGYLVRDSSEGKAWKYTYEKFWKSVFSRQEIGGEAYIMYSSHPEYWAAKVRLGFKPSHKKREMSRVAVDARKVVRDMVDWRDMLTSQDHLVFHNGQQKLIPVALEGYILGIPVDEIENTEFLKASDFDYSKIFNNTTFVFQGEQNSLVKMSYNELVHQRWNQIEMGY